MRASEMAGYESGVSFGDPRWSIGRDYTPRNRRSRGHCRAVVYQPSKFRELSGRSFCPTIQDFTPPGHVYTLVPPKSVNLAAVQLQVPGWSPLKDALENRLEDKEKVRGRWCVIGLRAAPFLPTCCWETVARQSERSCFNYEIISSAVLPGDS